MLELLGAYTLQEIAIFIVMLALAIKGIVDFYDWGATKLKNHYSAEHVEEEKDKTLADLSIQMKDLSVELKEMKSAIIEISDFRQYSIEQNNDQSEKIDMLIESDKDSIKAYITEKHHHHVEEKQWIDKYTLDCLERRFECYKKEGGNSFIEDLMNEIRALPKQPPK